MIKKNATLLMNIPDQIALHHGRCQTRGNVCVPPSISTQFGLEAGDGETSVCTIDLNERLAEYGRIGGEIMREIGMEMSDPHWVMKSIRAGR